MTRSKRFPTFAVDETTLVFAFRYALGRQSTAPSHMVAQLKKHWSRLETWTQFAIQREISQAIQRGEAGRDCDVATWREVISFGTRNSPVKDHESRSYDRAHDDGEACGCD